jgi:hypothetical protein
MPRRTASREDSLLRQLWRKWKALAWKIGNFQARVLLALLYFTLLLPFGVGLRLFSDPLRTKVRDLPTYWLPREARDEKAEARRQY